jgi:hypothetical protein
MTTYSFRAALLLSQSKEIIQHDNHYGTIIKHTEDGRIELTIRAIASMIVDTGRTKVINEQETQVYTTKVWAEDPHVHTFFGTVDECVQFVEQNGLPLLGWEPRELVSEFLWLLQPKPCALVAQS